MKSSDCGRIRRRLPFYLEGEVEPLESLRTASHLARCPRCSAEAERGSAVLSALRELPLSEPEPPRDIAAGVLSRLRAIGSALGPGAALKWSSLLLLLGAVILPGLFPDATISLGVRLLTKAGELVDLEALLTGILGSIPAIVPSLESAMNTVKQGLPAAGSATPFLLLVVLPILLLAAALVFAFLSGGLVLSAVCSSRGPAVFRRNRQNARFDNPPGLP